MTTTTTTTQLAADRGGLASDLAGPSAVEQELVVLVDDHGHITGTAPKQSVHHRDTPRHFGFSCYVVNAAGQVLLTQRAATKLTWPAVWTNSCCGHPAPDETLREAVTRRLAHELGMVPRTVTMLLEDFSYRAVMDNGVIENELCPVVAAMVDGEPAPNPAEVDDFRWVSWDQLQRRGGSSRTR